MILVDSSAWIEFQRATGSPTDLRLTSALASEEPLATTGLILLEILAGARDERQARDLRRLDLEPMSRDDALAMRGTGWEADLEQLREGYLRSSS